jgi:hypothetical protein
MNTFNWTPANGDYIPSEDDCTKKHARVLKREKIKVFALMAAASTSVTAVFLVMLNLIAKV